jgi:hypothetical protein
VQLKRGLSILLDEPAEPWHVVAMSNTATAANTNTILKTREVRGLAVWAQQAHPRDLDILELVDGVLAHQHWVSVYDALVDALPAEVRHLEAAAKAGLWAEENDGCWCVVDRAGGWWWPTEEVPVGDDPCGVATLLRCWRTPAAGKWRY